MTGEDPSKPDLTATLLARYIAVQVVGYGLAEFARVSLSYIIGHDELHLNVTTNGQGDQEYIEHWVRENVPLSLSQARKQFGLRDPHLYRQIVHDADLFQNPEYEWNRVNL